jgi:hypothetical protein
MGPGGWELDDDAVLQLLRAGVDVGGGGGCSLTDADVAAAGRAAFTWRTVDDELHRLLDPVTAGGRPSTLRSRED